VIFSRNGHDISSRFADIAYVLRDLPAKAAILDGELLASDRAGAPGFAELHRRTAAPHAGGRLTCSRSLAALRPREAPGAP
jgi:bifunctional non-homologous end joining protein LigD